MTQQFIFLILSVIIFAYVAYKYTKRSDIFQFENTDVEALISRLPNREKIVVCIKNNKAGVIEVEVFRKHVKEFRKFLEENGHGSTKE